ncbi:50S ribosomal protein L15 [Catenisphaera adipataccumulans]|jgi:large subunit ribosomal protein L15|uniref:Large ribosomal subunit protein uL15 n=1 Tax=Catenisphaera adipataccumulans TaxID=700500 RepID=A0A7W8FVE8_9FIRM|nr:50S ribosomal protein L15 [Catenisphaera adipataccumulans]MBB5183549.1 large subunit ribosomal protein L15 [Catenisphaera adipataccumulans]
MKLHEMKSTASRTARNRVGRGPGSGNGKTSGRGQKGQKSRSGGGTRLGFEGGQTTLARRLPKRGFTNFNRKEYAIVNVETLNRYDEGTVVNIDLLMQDKVVDKPMSGLKILGNGELNKRLVVQAKKFSKSAKEAIEKVGGTAEVI